MCQYRQSPKRGPRRGAILPVVLALLTLFGIVGLSFVFYGKQPGMASLSFRSDNSPGKPDVPAGSLTASVLGQPLDDTAAPLCGIGRPHAPASLAGTDDSQPLELGAEVGRQPRANVPHRLFAPVDRTAIAYDPWPKAADDLVVVSLRVLE